MYNIIPNPRARNKLPNSFNVLGSGLFGRGSEETAAIPPEALTALSMGMKVRIYESSDRKPGQIIWKYCSSCGLRQIMISVTYERGIRCEIVSPYMGRWVGVIEDTIIPQLEWVWIMLSCSARTGGFRINDKHVYMRRYVDPWQEPPVPVVEG